MGAPHCINQTLLEESPGQGPRDPGISIAVAMDATPITTHAGLPGFLKRQRWNQSDIMVYNGIKTQYVYIYIYMCVRASLFSPHQFDFQYHPWWTSVWFNGDVGPSNLAVFVPWYPSFYPCFSLVNYIFAANATGSWTTYPCNVRPTSYKIVLSWCVNICYCVYIYMCVCV